MSISPARSPDTRVAGSATRRVGLPGLIGLGVLIGLAALTRNEALWLALVWPVRLAFYGTDLFRTGGGDDHAGRFAFDAIAVVFALWAAGLLAFGLRTRYEWDWRRSAVALSLAIAAFALLGFAAALILRGSHHS